MGNVFFDTCEYDQPGIDLLFEVIVIDNIDALPIYDAGKRTVFEGSARQVTRRLDAQLRAGCNGIAHPQTQTPTFRRVFAGRQVR